MKRIRSLSGRGPGRAGLALLLCVSMTGCGAGLGEVSGTVRCNGKPLPFGTIQFLGADGIPRAGQVRTDGTFAVGVPPGEAKVIVSCAPDAGVSRPNGPSAASPGRAAPPAAGAAKRSLVPPRYADWDASGLTVRVERGQTTQDFALTSP